MNIFHSLTDLPASIRNGVAVIGNLDGVHLGHRSLIDTARNIGGPVVVLTFTPHPRRFFRPETTPFLLTSDIQKSNLLVETGVDGVVFLPFDRTLANHSADEFIREVLVDALGAQHIVVGSDFHFGHDRMGNVETLRAAGLPAAAVSLLHDAHGLPYSSTRAREYLHAGDIAAANQILGWEWEIWGTVIHGDKRGHDLGYPTANIDLGETLCPAYGVYAGWVWGDGHWHKAAINIGIRPMFQTERPMVEAHLLNFTGDLYGRHVRVRPTKKLRDEAKFSDLGALTAQIAQDCSAARSILDTPPGNI